MANPVWPLTLPQDYFIGVSFQRRSAFAQFTVDAGPAMRRRAFGNASTDVKIPMLFRQQQMVTFDDFYINTVRDGALEFDWIHPVTGAPASYRFNEYPSFSIALSAEGDLYQTTLNLELTVSVDIA